jgi:PAS domain S-box-containing protein
VNHSRDLVPESSAKALQHVLVIEDALGKRVIALRSATATIGRDLSSSIVLHSPRISRQHAILLRTTTPGNKNHQFRIIDVNLQGNRSTNGFKVNKVPCTSHDLLHGDEILLGGEVKARYYNAFNPEDIEYLTSCEIDDLSGFLSTLHNPFATLSGYTAEERQASNEVAIARLASIPELFIHPIIEINLSGEVTYSNPAATDIFPDIQILNAKHSIIKDVIDLAIKSSIQPFVREIEINSAVFEQSIHSISESDIIRIYLVDITERKKAEQKYLESQVLLHHAFDYASIGMALVSMNGSWLKVNNALCNILNYTESELLELKFQDIIDSKSVKDFMICTKEIPTDKEPTFQSENLYTNKYGHSVWIQSSISLVRNQLNVPEYFIAQIQDISDRKASQEALQKTTMLQTAILESTSHAVISTRIDGTITTFNTAAEEILGYRAVEVINQKTPLFFYKQSEVIERLDNLPENVETPRDININQFFDTIIKSSSHSKEWTYIRKDRSEFQVEVSVTTLHDSKDYFTGFLVTAQDITLRKNAEELLKQAYNDLDFRVKERTNALQLTNELLQIEIVERKNIQEELHFLQQVTQKISEAQNLSTALQLALQKICEATGWDYGEAWIPSFERDYLRYGAVWHIEDSALASLSKHSQTMTFAPYEGLPGRVWKNQELEWLHDIPGQPESVFLRLNETNKTQVSTGIGIPVIDNQQVIAVLVFFIKDLNGDQIRHVNLVSAAALQIGSLIRRKSAEGALRSSLATNTALVKALPDWMFRISLDGSVINSKSAKNSILPLMSRDFLGKNLKDLLPQEIAEQMLGSIIKAKSKKDLEIIEYQLDLDGEVYEFESRISLGEEEEVITIIRDITERKRAEAKICSALNREKELNELKTRFVSMASHEFRTPLATILASAELLEHYRHKWSEEKNLNHLKRIQSSTIHMKDLLNDVLLIGMAEAGKLEFKPLEIDLISFCKELIEEIQLSTQTHTIHFKSSCESLIIQSDQKLLRQIFYNLFSNAIKYSPGKKNVEVIINFNNDQAVILVRDEGIGIPENDIEKVFNAFDRATNVGNISGTGLGLSIIKKSVELHGGNITLNSMVNKGSTFVISFPLTRS